MADFRYKTQIPSITSQKATTKNVRFTDGMDTYSDNDDVKPTELVLAQDARFERIGRYRTKRGADRYSIPVGEAVNVQQTSTTGASDAVVSATQWAAMPLITTSVGRATRVDINLKTISTSKGTLLIDICSDLSNVPGEILATTAIPNSAITSSYAYVSAYFIAAPLLTNATKYWIVVRPQNSYTGTYNISSTTASATAVTSIGSGSSWSATSYALNVKLYTSTNTPTKGVFRAYRPNGQKTTFIAYQDSMATVNELTGALTVIKSGMNASASDYRFEMVQDSVYWVNGLEKPYKYDFTTVSSVSTAPYNASHIIEHAGYLFFIDPDDHTRTYFTNFALYDAFTSTDFIYVPAPKSYDGLTGYAKLNGILYMFGNRNKFALYGTDPATFNLSEAPSQRGTFSQESIVYDADYIYYASQDGVFKFDGSTEINIAKSVLPDYLAIPNKQSIRLELYNGRLHVFYTPPYQSDNTEAFVYNTLLGVVESKDTSMYVGRTYGRASQDETYLLGSNRVAALYAAEKPSNDYNMCGAPLQFRLESSFQSFGTPRQRKTAPLWLPTFASAINQYDVTIEYAFDMSDSVIESQSVSLSGGGARMDGITRIGDGHRMGGGETIEPNLYVSGEFKRIKRIYSHTAAFEPVEFDGEQLEINTQRLV